MYDVVVKDGLVLDGSSASGRIADVGVTGSRITAVGSDLQGDYALDAEGCVVAPGFIDIHTHYDAQVFWDPALSPSCYHGVTTVVAGNCGFSLAPVKQEDQALLAKTLERVEDIDIDALNEGIDWAFESFGEYLESVERHGSLLNFSAYAGHTALRIYVLGPQAFEREATAEEIAQMCRLLEECLRVGAVGFATSFAPTHFGVDGLPVPSRVAGEHEGESLLRVVSRYGSGIVSIVPGQAFPVDRLYELQPHYGVPFTYGALLAYPNGEHRRRLDVLGIEVGSSAMG